jgi:hypothetical protein
VAHFDARVAVSIATLAALNGWIAVSMFQTEYTPWMSSIEGSYIGISRWIQMHWTELSWFPLWYGGIPFENAYPPLLHVLVAATGKATGLSVARAYHAVCGVMYVLGPVALFWLAWRLTGSIWRAFIAGCVFSLLSPSAFLIPSVAGDGIGLWGARRLQSMAGYGEGPHVTAITLLMAALALWHGMLTRGSGWRIVAAAAAAAATALTNWLGAAALAAGVFSLATAIERPCWRKVLLTGVLAYAPAAPLIKPSTIVTMQRNARYGYETGLSQHVYLAIWLLGSVALALLLRRTKLGASYRFAIVFGVLMGTPPLVREYFGLNPLPQPERYHLEMEIAIAILAGALLGLRKRWAVATVAVILVILAVLQAPRWKRSAEAHMTPIDITKTLEWETARWLEEHMPGQRVFALGSTGFWINAFSAVPQMAGGFMHGRANPANAVATFLIPFTRGDGAGTAGLLKAFGVRAVVVGGERTRDAYRNFKDPGKFDGVLDEVWRSGDDLIYCVPSRTGSLAHVVSPAELVPGPARDTGLDMEAVKRYAAALDDAHYPPARFEWIRASQARVDAELRPGEMVSVQVTYHPGWRAQLSGIAQTVSGDGLGQLVIKSQCTGRCSFDLIYDGGWEQRIAWVLFDLGLAACVLLLWRRTGTLS